MRVTVNERDYTEWSLYIDDDGTWQLDVLMTEMPKYAVGSEAEVKVDVLDLHLHGVMTAFQAEYDEAGITDVSVLAEGHVDDGRVTVPVPSDARCSACGRRPGVVAQCDSCG